MEETCQIFWRDSDIGTFTIINEDMYYLEGIWSSNVSDEAKKFDTIVSKFDLKEIMQNPAKGTKVILKYHGSESSNTHALVIGLLENKLNIRRVYDDKAVQWLIDNVN